MVDKDLQRLNDICVELEDENTTIKKGVELYEEGINIAKSLFEEINKTKGKITILKQELDKFREEGLDK